MPSKMPNSLCIGQKSKVSGSPEITNEYAYCLNVVIDNLSILSGSERVCVHYILMFPHTSPEITIESLLCCKEVEL